MTFFSVWWQWAGSKNPDFRRVSGELTTSLLTDGRAQVYRADLAWTQAYVLSSAPCTKPSASFVDARERHQKPSVVGGSQSLVEIVIAL
jgi:hypothetical protein